MEVVRLFANTLGMRQHRSNRLAACRSKMQPARVALHAIPLYMGRSVEHVSEAIRYGFSGPHYVDLVNKNLRTGVNLLPSIGKMDTSMDTPNKSGVNIITVNAA